MKIAICLCGEARFAEKGKTMMVPFYKHVDIDYYIHSWSNIENNETIKNNLTNLFNPKKIKIDYYLNFDNYFQTDTFVDKSPNKSNCISWLKSVYEVGKLIETSSENYDWVIFTRTDIIGLGKSFFDCVSTVEKNTICSSFVPGDIWIIDQYKLENKNFDGHIDAKFICSSKSNMIYFSKLFNYLKTYCVDEQIPLCHHRLIYHHLKNIIKKVKHQMITLDDNHVIKGWYFLRNNELSNY